MVGWPSTFCFTSTRVLVHAHEQWFFWTSPWQEVYFASIPLGRQNLINRGVAWHQRETVRESLRARATKSWELREPELLISAPCIFWIIMPALFHLVWLRIASKMVGAKYSVYVYLLKVTCCLGEEGTDAGKVEDTDLHRASWAGWKQHSSLSWVDFIVSKKLCS